MTQPPIYLVERQTVDWLALDDDAFYAQSVAFCRLWGKPDDFIWRLKLLWDQTFVLSYCETRERLKRIAHRNWQAAYGLSAIPFQHYQNVPLLPEAWYLFVDDDDWVSPDLVALLCAQPVLSSCDAVLWRATNIGSPQQADAVFTWGLNGRVMTNNYAVSGRWLLESAERFEQVVQHHSAYHCLNAMQLPQLDLAITASNKSPISSVSLERGLQGEFTQPKLRQLIRSYVEKMRAVEPQTFAMAAWLAPWLAETTQLFAEVLQE